MERREQATLSAGRRSTLYDVLRLIHNYNALLAALTLITGIMLYVPAFRPYLAPIRVPLKWVHIGLGLLFAVLVILHSPRVLRFRRFIRGLLGKQLNYSFAWFIWFGLSVSGIMLWFHRRFPPLWQSAALTWHDWLTLALVPWFLVHAFLRYFRIRVPVLARFWHVVAGFVGLPSRELHSVQEIVGDVQDSGDPVRRRTLLWIAGVAAALVFGLPGRLFALFEAAGGGGGGVSTVNRSLAQEEAGASHVEQGWFRYYTVVPGYPDYDPNTWKLVVDGLVGNKLTFTLDDIYQHNAVTKENDFHCVTGWSVYNARWKGIPLDDVLRQAKPQSGAGYVKFYSFDGAYTDLLTMSQAMEPNVLLVYGLDGKPLPHEMGAPLRLFVPDMYGYKSVKWLSRIELTASKEQGYWEARGYPADAYLDPSRKGS